MIEHEFLFLGLLMGGPRHGYDIKRKIDEELRPSIGIDIKSIYYPLQQMEKHGLIVKNIGREGRWPQKQVYQITPKGRKKFDELIAASFLSVEQPFFEIDLSLYFLPYVPKGEAKRRLKGRLTLLNRIGRGLKVAKEKACLEQAAHSFILQHNLHLVQAEITSIQEIMGQI